MAVIPVPSLSSAGWVVSPAEKADLLISHFYASDKSQTFLYGSNVANLQWVIEQSAHDIVNLVALLERELVRYLSAYYSNVTVEVASDETLGTVIDNRVTLRVYASVTENDGTTYSFGKLLNVVDSKIASIVNLNNFGT
jgi:hypothetical protein